MKNVFLLLPFLFLGFSANACLNEYGHRLNGQKLVTRYFYLADRDLSFNTSELKTKLSELRASDDDSFQNQSNIAVVLMKLGKAKEALALLKPLIARHPKEYQLNANIGTAYELTGDLENALKYIKKGYQIFPDAHHKSEWIHVKIIEAKIKEQSNPGWLRSHPIVTVEELVAHMHGREMHPEYRHHHNQLAHQIKTRAPFTPAPNAVIANLALTLGEFSEKHGIYENALMAYIYTIEFREKKRYATDIYTKIRRLNSEREKSGMDALPNQFRNILRVASVDPDLLVAAITDFEEVQFSQDSLLNTYNDSLTLLKEQLSEVENTEKEVKTQSVPQSKESTSIGFIALFTLGGLLLGFVVARKLRKPERK